MSTSSSSFAPFKKFQVLVLFASLTILYLIYAVGSGGYSAISSDGVHSPIPSLAISNPASHEVEDKPIAADKTGVADTTPISKPISYDDEDETPAVKQTDPVDTEKLSDHGEDKPTAANQTDTSITEVLGQHDTPAASENATVSDAEEYVAFCVAHRNQRRDLPEFLNHHYHHHGIRRFYIMDDRSEPPLSSFNDFGIPRSALSFQYYDEKGQHDEMQQHIYSECARLYGSLHTWMAFIDADEFFETRDGETLPSILHEFDNVTDVGALGVNWRLHSSANLTSRPESMRASFTSCVDDPEILPVAELPNYKDNRLIKSIVKTALFEKPLTPHLFKTRNGTHTVGEHGDRIEDGDGIRQPITRDRIGLHHYTTKSKEQFEEKMKSWSAKGWEYWDHIEGLPQVHCEEMTKYSP